MTLSYHSGLFENLAVNHVPGPLAKRKHPQQEEKFRAVLYINTD